MSSTIAAQSLLEFANAAYQKGDWSTAYKNWTAAVELVDPSQQHLIHSNRGVALEKLGHTSKAVEAYDEALNCLESHVESWHNRAVALQKLGKTDEALTSFEGALYYDSSFAPSLRGRFNALIELRRFDDAVVAANAAIAAQPGNPEPVVDRAFAHMQAGRFLSAQSDYELAQSMGDESQDTMRQYAACLVQLGMQLDQAGDLAGADSMYTSALQIEPTESALFNRAYVRQRQGKLPEAVAGFQAVISRNPTHAEATAAAGTLLVQLGRHAEAVPLLAAAAAQRPDQAEIMFNCGFALYSVGDFVAAIGYLERAKALDVTRSIAVLDQVLAAARAGQAGGSSVSFSAPTVGSGASAAFSGAAAAPAAPAAAGPAAGGIPPPIKPPMKPKKPTEKGVAEVAAAAPAPAAAAATTAAADKGRGGAAGAGAARGGSGTVESVTTGFKGLRATGGAGTASKAATTTTAAAASKVSTAKATAAAAPAPAAAAAKAAAPAPAPAPAASRSGSPSGRYATTKDGADGQVFTYAQLKAPCALDGIDVNYREAYMTEAEFKQVIGVSKAEFYAQPKWKRANTKKTTGLF